MFILKKGLYIATESNITTSQHSPPNIIRNGHIYHYHHHLSIVVTSPLDLLQQVSEVRPDRDVVLPRPQLSVEMLVVARILL